MKPPLNISSFNKFFRDTVMLSCLFIFHLLLLFGYLLAGWDKDNVGGFDIIQLKKYLLLFAVLQVSLYYQQKKSC